MDTKRAQDILMAVACCSTGELLCVDCPLREADGRCRPWTNEEAAEAVWTLKKERDGNG